MAKERTWPPHSPGTDAAAWRAHASWGRVPELGLANDGQPCTRLVVVAAHPDDESLGTGGLIAAAHDAGLTVYVVLLTAGRLLAVNWLPPWRGWEDAMLYLFDLGVHADGELDPRLFLRREIAGAHWRAVAEAGAHVAPYTARMLEVAADAEHTAYLENSEPVAR